VDLQLDRQNPTPRTQLVLAIMDKSIRGVTSNDEAVWEAGLQLSPGVALSAISTARQSSRPHMFAYFVSLITPNL
jgi:hypothetical protein